MANVNLTTITPPRVPLTDERTGLISPEWYRFFLNLFNLTGGGKNTASLTDLQLGPPPLTQEDLATVKVDIQTQDYAIDQMAELQKQIEGLQLQPQLDVATITAAINALSSAPVTKTADFTVADTNVWLINNRSGATCTVTLPSAPARVGRVLYFQNYQAQTLVSASSNVVPLAGGAAGTAILAATAGVNATLVSDGTNWIITQ
jgi:hypothetical protein